jgi:hypothetical protein
MVDRVSASNGFLWTLWVFQGWLLSPLLYLYNVSSTYFAITSLCYDLRVSKSLPCVTSHVAGAGRVFAQVDDIPAQHPPLDHGSSCSLGGITAYCDDTSTIQWTWLSPGDWLLQ